MAIKELKKNVEMTPAKIEKDVESFISKGGSVTQEVSESDEDHRLTLRIPKHMMQLIDKKRKERVGKISSNLWILELIDKAVRK